MNIFVLDYDVKKCVEYHCDKHVVKMILESAQMMCTVAREVTEDKIYVPYKTTHLNHPCTKWARESRQNFLWLMDLFNELHEEWQYRFNHDTDHLSYYKLQEVDWELVLEQLPNIGLTQFAQAMPEEYRNDDAVIAYRNYYINDKAGLLTYTQRSKPEWIK